MGLVRVLVHTQSLLFITPLSFPIYYPSSIRSKFLSLSLSLTCE